MKFYGREDEIALLRKFRDKSRRSAQLVVLTGRRRVGKTALVRRALDDGKLTYLHLAITRQSEVSLCQELQSEVERVLDLGILGTCSRFADLFRKLMEASLRRPFTLVLDEFQEFDRINPAVFSQVAAVWDQYHGESKVSLVVCGSINRLMNKIFFDDGEPLYGRNTGSFTLRPFKVSLLKKILSANRPKYTPDDLLSLWTVTGGIPRYVDLMLQDGATTTAEMKNLVGADVNGYLTKLEDQYALVSKKQPLYEKPSGKNCHYQIDDCFFRFWFRFVFKYRGLIELERYQMLRELVARDFDVFSGYALERYFLWKFTEDTSYSQMGAWWNRRGEEEIDLVCENGLDGTLDFYEIKRDASRFDRGKLEEKVAAFFVKHPARRPSRHLVKGLSMADM